MSNRETTQERLARAREAGVSDADLGLVGVLLHSMVKSVKEMSLDESSADVSLVIGMAMGATIALEESEAGAEMVRVLGFMLDEQEALDHLRRETVRLYLTVRAARLAEDGRHG